MLGKAVVRYTFPVPLPQKTTRPDSEEVVIDCSVVVFADCGEWIA